MFISCPKRDQFRICFSFFHACYLTDFDIIFHLPHNVLMANDSLLSKFCFVGPWSVCFFSSIWHQINSNKFFFNNHHGEWLLPSVSQALIIPESSTENLRLPQSTLTLMLTMRHQQRPLRNANLSRHVADLGRGALDILLLTPTVNRRDTIGVQAIVQEDHLPVVPLMPWSV